MQNTTIWRTTPRTLAENWYVDKCQRSRSRGGNAAEIKTKYVHKQKASLPLMVDVLVVNGLSNLSLRVGILIFRKPLR